MISTQVSALGYTMQLPRLLTFFTSSSKIIFLPRLVQKKNIVFRSFDTSTSINYVIVTLHSILHNLLRATDNIVK